MDSREVKNLVQGDFFKTEDQLRRIMIDPIGKDIIRRVFMQTFLSVSSSAIRKNWWTTYRLFSEISWTKLRGLPSDFVVETCFGKQLVMACILKFEPIDEVLWYLAVRFPDKADAIAEYARIRKAVFESDMIVGVYKNQPQTVKSIVDEIIRLNQMGNQSLEVAEYKAKLESIFFSELPDPGYIERLDIDKRDSVATFFSFIHFLIGVKPELIYGLVEENMRADQEVVRSAAQIEREEVPESIEEKTIESPQVLRENYFVRIQKEIQEKMSGSSDIDETEIFAQLQKYALQYQDPRILDLYYFDEESGEFLWNEELTKDQT